MSQTDATLLGDDGSSHGRRQIVDHDDHIDGMLIEELIEGRHDLRGNLVKTGGRDAQEELRRSYLEIAKERRLERRIILSTSIHQQTLSIAALTKGTNQGRNFHKIGACATENTYIFCHNC